MKSSNFDAKKFLNAKSLSPLESSAVKGGTDVKQKEKVKKADVKVDVKVAI